jgi:hypothetical protein
LHFVTYHETMVVSPCVCQPSIFVDPWAITVGTVSTTVRYFLQYLCTVISTVQHRIFYYTVALS